MTELLLELREIRRWLIWQTALLAAIAAANGIALASVG